MDQCEDREEGVPPSKSTLCGEHESQTKAQRNQRGTKRKHEPEPSCVSCKNDRSKGYPIDFKVQPAERNLFKPDSDSDSGSSCLSFKSDSSADLPINFKDQKASASERNLLEHDSDSGSSCLSFKSDSSADLPINFKDQKASASERVEPAGVRWLTPGLRKYSCQLTIDTNTVHKNLQLSDNNRKVTHVEEVQSYPDHPDRFDVKLQLLCRNGLTGRCYWEVEWRGDIFVSVSYRSIRRKGGSDDCAFGRNDQSWSLICSDDGPCSVWHNNREKSIASSSSSSSSSSSVSNRAAVYVDCPAGTLSFYRVSSDTLIHLHTFNTTFTEPLYPGFRVLYPGDSVSLC